jgi:hypothetical protein
MATSVGQAVLTMSALIVVSIAALATGWSDLPPLLRVAFLLVSAVMLGCGIATIVTLRRNPEMRTATRQRRPLDESGRRRYVVATLIGTVIAMAGFVVAGLTQTSAAWLVVAAAVLATLACFLQIGRPLSRPRT